jgi:hypothetical protein
MDEEASGAGGGAAASAVQEVIDLTIEVTSDEIEARRGTIPRAAAESVILCVAYEQGGQRRWKNLAEQLKPVFANRKAMSDAEEALKKLIICGLSHEEQLAYDDKLDAKSKHDTEEIVERRTDHARAVSKVRTLYNRVLDYTYPIPKAEPTKAALEAKAAKEAAKAAKAAAAGGASSSSSSSSSAAG